LPEKERFGRTAQAADSSVGLSDRLFRRRTASITSAFRGDVLDRLYMTFCKPHLGGEEFDTIVKGELLQPTVDLKMDSLYF